MTCSSYPELSVHTDDLEILKSFAITHQTIILAGLVYHEARAGDGLPLVNSAVWLLPERTALGGHKVRVVDQGKRYLAPEETQAGLNIRSFRTSQWLIGYPWSRDSREPYLWLTASVCYDATNLALAADLKGRSDVYVIPGTQPRRPDVRQNGVGASLPHVPDGDRGKQWGVWREQRLCALSRSLQTTTVPLSWPAASRDRLSRARSDRSVFEARPERSGSQEGPSVQTASSGPDLISDVR